MSQSGVLAKIAEHTKLRVMSEKRQESQEFLVESLEGENARRPHDFLKIFTSKPGPRIIAEVKFASPSEGDIVVGLNPLDVATQYLSQGAAALSILTEPDFFKGSLEYLRTIRNHFPNALLLMKDFVLDEYQLLQARVYGADAILLIVDMIAPSVLSSLYEKALKLGLTPLVEVHNEAELNRAIELKARLIGVNNRNLRTMEVSLESSVTLSARAPLNCCLISESGIKTGNDLRRLGSAGYQGFLIGTHFMRTGEPGASLARLIGDALSNRVEEQIE